MDSLTVNTSTCTAALVGPTSSFRHFKRDPLATTHCCALPPQQLEQQPVVSLFGETDLSYQDIEEAMLFPNMEDDDLIDKKGLPSSTFSHRKEQQYDDAIFVECHHVLMKSNDKNRDNLHHSIRQSERSLFSPFEDEVVSDMDNVQEEGSVAQSNKPARRNKRCIQEDDNSHDTTLSSMKHYPLKKRRKKKPKRGDDGMPKRPLSAYNLFFRAKRAEVMAGLARSRIKEDDDVEKKHDSMDDCDVFTTSNPTHTSVSLTGDFPSSHQMLGKHVGKLWRELDPNQKKIFQAMNARDCERYRQEMEAILARNSNKEKETPVESCMNKHTSAVSVIGTSNKTSSTATPPTMVTPSHSPRNSLRTLDMALPRDAPSRTRVSDMSVRPSYGHSPRPPAGSSFSLFPPPPYPPVSRIQMFPPSLSMVPTVKFSYRYKNMHHVLSQETYPCFDRLPPSFSPTHPCAVAMPPGMEILLQTNDYSSTNSQSGKPGSNSKTAANTRTTNAPTSDQAIYNGVGNNRSLQKYLLIYTSYSMTRSDADSLVDTFMTRGLKAHATTNCSRSTIPAAGTLGTESISRLRANGQIDFSNNDQGYGPTNGARITASIVSGQV